MADKPSAGNRISYSNTLLFTALIYSTVFDIACNVGRDHAGPKRIAGHPAAFEVSIDVDSLFATDDISVAGVAGRPDHVGAQFQVAVAGLEHERSAFIDEKVGGVLRVSGFIDRKR